MELPERDRFDEIRDQMNVVFESLRGDIRLLAEGHAYVVEAVDDLRAGHARLEAGQADLRSEMRTGQEALRRDMTGVQADMTGLRADMTGLRADMTGLRADMTVVQADMTGFRAEMTGLRADMTVVQADTTGLRADMAEFRVETREGFRSVRAAMDSRDVRLDDRVGRVERDVAVLKRQVKSLGPRRGRS